MVEIPLTQGKVTIVDEIDLSFISHYRFYARKDPANGVYYAVANTRKADGSRTAIKLHRLIMNAKPGQEIDHIDRNGLNNLRDNLRFATRSQNMNNTGSRRNGASRFKGVCWYKKNKKWGAQIRHDGKKVFLGLHVNEENAARAYDAAAKKYFGEFAYLNFPP